MPVFLKELPKWLIVLLAFYFATLIGYAVYDNRKVNIWPPSIEPRIQTENKESSTKFFNDEMLVEAQRRNRPFLVQALTLFVHIEAINSKGLRVEERTCYNLLPLQSISANKNTLFPEGYSEPYAQRIQYWPGTEREIFNNQPGDGTDYDVLFDLNKGETRTVVTGATIYYKIPLTNGRKDFGDRLSLSSHELFSSYSNTDDVIREITIIVDSPSLHIRPVGRAAKRSYPDRTVEEQDAIFHKDDSSSSCSCSISYRWQKILPGETVGIDFTWD